MDRVCAWCKELLGVEEGIDLPPVTHGIFESCRRRVEAEQREALEHDIGGEG